MKIIMHNEFSCVRNNCFMSNDPQLAINGSLFKEINRKKKDVGFMHSALARSLALFPSVTALCERSHFRLREILWLVTHKFCSRANIAFLRTRFKLLVCGLLQPMPGRKAWSAFVFLGSYKSGSHMTNRLSELSIKIFYAHFFKFQYASFRSVYNVMLVLTLSMPHLCYWTRFESFREVLPLLTTFILNWA